MNRRTIDILFGLASGAVGLAAALYTAVLATPQEETADDAAEQKEEAALSSGNPSVTRNP